MKESTGVVAKKESILIYGKDKIGKSSWCASFPSPVFVDIEKRTDHLPVARYQPETSKEVMEALDKALASKHETIVIDSADWLEKLLLAELLADTGKPSIDKVGDYGAGYSQLRARFMPFIEKMREINKTKNLIITSHYQIKMFNNPTTEPYEMYLPKLDKEISQWLCEMVDNIFFASEEVLLHGKLKKRAIDDGKRYLFTNPSAAYKAGQSFDLPDKFELLEKDGYKYYLSLKKFISNATPVELIAEIESYFPKCEETYVALVKEKMKGADEKKLRKILDFVKEEVK